MLHSAASDLGVLYSKQWHSIFVHTFASNWQLPFLNQWKGENDSRNVFMMNLSWDSNLQPPESAVSCATQLMEFPYTYYRGLVKEEYLVIILG